VADDDRLAALRIEYAAARLDFDRALADVRASKDRLHELASRVQDLYLRIYMLEHGLTEEDA
jgi:hypothetical protein